MFFYDSSNGYLGIEKTLYETDYAEQAYNSLVYDVQRLTNVFGSNVEKVSVYIVEKPATGSPYSSGRKIFCSKSDFDNGAYRSALVQASLQTSETWLVYGIAGYIFNENVIVDDSVLAEYYDYTENMNTLGLFAGRFYPDWNTSEQIDIAKATSISLCRYIAETYSADRLLEDIGSVEKQEWLAAIGSIGKYEYPHEEALNRSGWFEYSSSEDYPLIITNENASYYLKPVMFIENSDELESFLYFRPVRKLCKAQQNVVKIITWII